MVTGLIIRITDAQSSETELAAAQVPSQESLSWVAVLPVGPKQKSEADAGIKTTKTHLKPTD